MAAAPGTVDYLLEQAAGTLTARKMFGAYALYHGGKLVALVCDDQLFVKVTAAGRILVRDAIEAAPYPGAKPCLIVSGELWEDGEWLARLFSATASELPEPKPRKTSAARKPRTRA